MNLEKSELIQIIINEVEAGRINSSNGHYCECKQLFADLWTILTTSQQKLFGRCFAELVSLRRVPFEYCGLSSSRHNLYKLIDK